MGALHKLIPLGVDYDQTLILVKDVAEAGQWNERYIRNLLPQNLVEYILHKINPPKDEEESNRPYWKLESTRKFTMTSAFHHIRQRQEVNKVYNYIWTKGAIAVRTLRQKTELMCSYSHQLLKWCENISMDQQE
ncbi:hypothetical protein KY284_030991 [Solanum tuberosum]|nr:hypothetical protein KY284_030991 [Solanum tuberosum]